MAETPAEHHLVLSTNLGQPTGFVPVAIHRHGFRLLLFSLTVMRFFPRRTPRQPSRARPMLVCIP